MSGVTAWINVRGREVIAVMAPDIGRVIAVGRAALLCRVVEIAMREHVQDRGGHP